MKRQLLFGGVVGAVVGAVAVWAVVAAAGAGHGTYLLAAMLFPLSMLVAVSVRTINIVASVLALAQYPIYGVFIAKTPRSKARWLALACSHFLVAAVAILSVQHSDAFG